MSNLPRNLPALLRAAGLEVIEVDGWQTRGRPASSGGFEPVGVLNHHTGASAKAWSRAKRLIYATWMFVTGRSDLPAPLCQIALGPDGEVYIGAAGRANHAGTAQASGSVGSGDGNRIYVGIEWMLSGTEEIPAAMMRAGAILNAVLTEKVTETSVQAISCHYNTSVTGKWDIGDPNGVAYKGTRVLDIVKFRRVVAEVREVLYRKKPVQPQVPDDAPDADSLVVGSWNVKVGPREGFLDELAAEVAGKHVIGLMETAGHRTRLRPWADMRGWTVVTGPLVKGDEEPLSSALLVREGVKVMDSGALGVDTRWVGPQGGVHNGRTFPWAKVQVGDQTLIVMVVHMPWGPTRRANKRAWRDCHKSIRRFCENYPNTDILLIGDWNQAAQVDAYYSVARTASKIGARVVAGSSPIDYGLFRPGAKATAPTKATGKRGLKRGSDHYSGTYTLTK